MGKVPPPAFLRKPLVNFGVNYSRDYQTFLRGGVLSEPFHPLFHLRKRIAEARPKTGLWWHVATGPNTSKRRVVRSWVVRRLRNAFRETLRERGVDEDGKINPRAHKGVDEGLRASNRKGIREALERGEEVEIKGSVKLHALAPIVTAKFVDVKTETGIIVEGLLENLVNVLRTRHTQIIAADNAPQMKHPQKVATEQSRRRRTTPVGDLPPREKGPFKFQTRTKNISSTREDPLRSPTKLKGLRPSFIRSR
jgi:hypothetical protein